MEKMDFGGIKQEKDGGPCSRPLDYCGPGGCSIQDNYCANCAWEAAICQGFITSYCGSTGGVGKTRG
ncbi:MAG: hypothetical protein JXA60_12165 [Candidatus Coatesbacteria bacterium]|nr:hypothetical protein [Candidatus Coatesbacteria bacterium]